MKQYLLLIISVLFLAACSSPKYAYYFDHYDYNSGKKKTESSVAATMPAMPEVSPLMLDKQALEASVADKIVPIERGPLKMEDEDLEAKRTLLAEKYSSLSKAEKREFRKEVKAVVKEVVKAKKEGKSLDSIEATKAMDYDLKMALIFGIVGIVLSAFGGVNSVFWILGVVAIVVAIVFLIKWIAEQ